MPRPAQRDVIALRTHECKHGCKGRERERLSDPADGNDDARNLRIPLHRVTMLAHSTTPARAAHLRLLLLCCSA